jgi:cytochrome oxidase Cu insertion factor (SCO1/SenC/PrrC family)
MLVALAFSALTWLHECSSPPARVMERKDSSNAQPHASASIPEQMPEFDLKDPAGREISSAQFRGRVVLLDFWAT